MITALSLSPAVDKIYFVENFEAGSLYRVKDIFKSAGGKGINVSRVACLLGENVTTMGFKAGSTGNWLEEKLAEVGAKTVFFEVEGESRTNSNIIDKATGKETELLEMGPFISAEQARAFVDKFTDLLEHTGVLVCSGGLPCGIPVDFYRKLLEVALQKGIPAILDTSNEVLLEGIKACPYLIKPNLRELSAFTGKNLKTVEDITRASMDIIAGGVRVVVTSMGSEGALLVTSNSIIRAYAPEIEVVNTIGSGDSMVAGFAAAIERKASLDEMLKLGMACAAANANFKEIGFISMELVNKYLKEIRIDYIKEA
jgi:1-phosphofructokinase/tagatose 6-phosphate kinase